MSQHPPHSSNNNNNIYDSYIQSSNITNVWSRMYRLNHPVHHSKQHPHDSNIYDMYGTIYGQCTAVIHMAHPVPIRDILLLSTTTTPSSSSSSSTKKTPAYDHFSSFCGRGVFTTDGDDWTVKRHAVVAALFRRGNFVEGLEDVCHVTATRLIRTIRRPCRRPNNNDNNDDHHHHHHNTIQHPKKLNIVPLLQRATIGLIYRYLTHASDERCAWAAPKETEEEEGTETTTTTTKSTMTPADDDDDPMDDDTNEGFLQEYLQAITNIRLNLLAQSRSLAYLLLPRWVYQHGGSRLYTMEQQDLLPAIRSLAHSACRQAQPQSPLHQLLQNPIYHQPSTKAANDEHPMDTTDSTKSKSKTTASSSSSSSCFSKNIIDETITLLFAGQDTTAATLSWTLHLLTLYPQVQEKLYQEITAHILENDNTSDNDITIRKKHVTQMPYLDAVIKESMRLYPVAPFIVRNIGGHGGGGTTDRNNTKESKAFPRPLPDNTLACIWIYSLHRHPTYWSRPDEFIPERWLVHLQPPAPQPNSSSSTKSSTSDTTNMPDLGIRTPCAYIPYATGARNCLGQPMANLILRILLCRLMISFEFSDERVVQLQQQQQQQPTPQNGDNENDTTTASQQPLSHEQILPLHKEMQAGFTVLPLGGLELVIKERRRKSIHPK